MSCGLCNHCPRASFQRCFRLQNMLLKIVAPPGIVQLLHWFLPTAVEFYRSFLCVPVYHICCISHLVSTNIFVKDDLFSCNEDRVDRFQFFDCCCCLAYCCSFCSSSFLCCLHWSVSLLEKLLLQNFLAS